MITSADFRAQNKVLFSAPILKGVKVEEDFSAGWGSPCSTGEVDVIDLNGNGQADARPQPKNYSRDAIKQVFLEEPVLHAPGYQAIQELAAKKDQQVVTSSDLPGGVFIANPRAVQVSDSQVETSRESIRSLEVLVAERFDPNYPTARWAIDTAEQQFLVYVPPLLPLGGRRRRDERWFFPQQ